jgi:hypothetical protein
MLRARFRTARSARVAVVAVLLASACTGGSHPSVTSAKPGGSEPAGAAARASRDLWTDVDDARLHVALPTTAEQSTAGLSATLRKTLPPPEPVAGFSAGQVHSALRWLSGLVAATRGDVTWLCTDGATKPVDRYATSGLRKFIDNPKNKAAVRAVEATIPPLTGSVNTCAGAHFVGPGAVAGPQRWTVRPGTRGAQLDVVYSGTWGYALANAQGVATPVGGRFQIRYGIVRDGNHWMLQTWADWYSQGANGFFAHVPLPARYLTQPPPVPPNNAAALAAVKRAVDRWHSTSAVRYSATLSVSGRDTRATSTSTYAGAVAPSRGDAELVQSSTGGKGTQDERILRHGADDFRSLTKGAALLPGVTGPAHPKWSRFHPNRPYGAGAGFDSSPFAVVALLDSALVARWVDCPSPSGSRCAEIAIPTHSARQAELTKAVLWNLYGAGQPYLSMTVVIDQRGAIAGTRRAGTYRALGSVVGTSVWTTSFAAITAVPPVVTPPPPSITADETDIWYPTAR